MDVGIFIICVLLCLMVLGGVASDCSEAAQKDRDGRRQIREGAARVEAHMIQNGLKKKK